VQTVILEDAQFDAPELVEVAVADSPLVVEYDSVLLVENLVQVVVLERVRFRRWTVRSRANSLDGGPPGCAGSAPNPADQITGHDSARYSSLEILPRRWRRLRFPASSATDWSAEQRRWIRTDPEYLDRATPAGARTEDLRPGEFLTAGEPWQLVRSGQREPIEFGVFGTENWGLGEIRGNAMRDLASLARNIEMLPWDVWGPMEDSYNDQLATATADPEHPDLESIYAQLAVPESMIC
jgi:hypothetical protein